MPEQIDYAGVALLQKPQIAVPMGPFRVVILMPVYSDWESASLVCQSLDKKLSKLIGVEARVLFIDDGSPNGLDGWSSFKTRAITQMTALRLRRNLGHQRAICTGLCYIQEHMCPDAVLVMDADGEDRPEDAVRLIEMALSSPRTVVFAERRKRLERMPFQVGYRAFRITHRMLTGIPVRVGNFSIISFSLLSRLGSMPELWNHYAGAVFKSRIRFECVPMDRGQRIRGQSQMNLSSLVSHGLAGIATFHETVATRILIANAIALAVLLISLAAVISVRLFTDRAIPGWATYSVGLIAILLTQIMSVSFSLVFSLLSNRSSAVFVPLRDCATFVDQVQDLVETV